MLQDVIFGATQLNTSTLDIANYYYFIFIFKLKKKQFSLYPKKMLNVEGFVVLRDAVLINDTLLRKIQKATKKSGSIFNDNDMEGNDRKRKQVSISLSLKEVPGFEKVLKLLPSPLDELNMEWVVLESLPGCHQQGAHIDYVFDKRKRLKASDISHGCLLAVQDGTKFDVWPSAHRLLVRDYSHDQVAIERCTLLLSKGDLVVFRADCVHAGAAYDEYNMRLHCFIDTTAMPHTTNRVGRYKTLGLPVNVLREA
jgi:hypothetical protein